jgi:hypothetical protein
VKSDADVSLEIPMRTSVPGKMDKRAVIRISTDRILETPGGVSVCGDDMSFESTYAMTTLASMANFDWNAGSVVFI